MEQRQSSHRSWLGVVAAGFLAVGCSGTEGTATSVGVATTSSARSTTGAPTSDTVSSPTSSATTPLAAHLAFAPPFVVAGSKVPILLVLPDTAPTAAIVVEIGQSSASRAAAVFEPESHHWIAVIDVPEGSSSLSLTVTEPTFGRSSDELTVPIAPSGATIAPSLVEVQPQRLVALPWGDGDGEAGYRTEAETDPVAPTSVAIDPRNGNLLVLDTVNRRVLIVSGSAAVRTIDLPGEGFVSDLVVAGDRGVAVVDGFGVGRPVVTVFLLDLDSGIVTETGPGTIPANAPVNAPLVWNPADAAVYAAIGNQFYPLVNVETGELQLERAPITWLDTTVDADGTLALGIGTGSIGVKFEETPGGLLDLVVGDNGDIWLLNSTIGAADSSGNTVHFWLVHLDPVAHTAAMVKVALGYPFDGTRRLTVVDDTAYVMSNGTNSLVIDSYELPPPLA